MATSTELRISSIYLEHSGGTKFYEMVLLSRGDVGMVIKRYGVLGLKKGGGQVLIERGSTDQAVDNFNSTLKQKRRRGYSDANGLADYGLHQVRAAITSVATRLAREHYSNDDTVRAIEDYFGIGVAPAATAAVSTPEPEPAIDRGAEWGMF